MKLRTLLLSATLTLLFSGTAWSVPVRSSRPALQAKPAQWKALSSRAGRFTTLFPAPPVTKRLVLAEGDPSVLWQFYCHSRGSFYLVQYTDRPEKNIQILGVDEMLQLQDTAFTKATQATVVSHRSITLSSFPGRETSSTLPDGGKQLCRFYLVGTRIYFFLIQQPASPTAADAAALAKFLNSFTLLPETKR